MKITRDEARRIAELARLEFDESTLERFAGEMSRILEYIDQLPSNDESEHDEPRTAPLREDAPRQYPKIVDGFFIVPKVIE